MWDELCKKGSITFLSDSTGKLCWSEKNTKMLNYHLKYESDLKTCKLKKLEMYFCFLNKCGMSVTDIRLLLQIKPALNPRVHMMKLQHLNTVGQQLLFVSKDHLKHFVKAIPIFLPMLLIVLGRNTPRALDQQVHVLYIISATQFMIQFVSNKVLLRLIWIQPASATDKSRCCSPKSTAGGAIKYIYIQQVQVMASTWALSVAETRADPK